MIDSLVGDAASVSYLHTPARDPRASSAFYRDVFGWPLHGADDDPHFRDGTGQVIGRRVTDQAATGEDGVRPYIYVADVDTRLAAIIAAGGQVVTPPYPEAALRVALFADPAGTVLGIWTENAAGAER
jgi:predicted enzyme related to lactoylglutathione lyase